MKERAISDNFLLDGTGIKEGAMAAGLGAPLLSQEPATALEGVVEGNLSVSFVVPAWNEELLLGSCLRVIRESADGLGWDYEVIVVDDASTDGTAEVAGRWADRTVRVCCRKISAVRNAGGRVGRGALLIFVDADTWVTARVLELTMSAVQAGAIGGGSRVRFEGRVPLLHKPGLWFFQAYQRLSPIAFGCFLFCRRVVFEELGGFDERLYVAEEIAMSRMLRARGRFVIVPAAVTTSGRKLNVRTAMKLFIFVFRLALRGPKFLSSPVGKSIWYGQRG